MFIPLKSYTIEVRVVFHLLLKCNTLYTEEKIDIVFHIRFQSFSLLWRLCICISTFLLKMLCTQKEVNCIIICISDNEYTKAMPQYK